MQGRLKGAVNRHHFPGGFHLRGNLPVAVGKLVKGPAGDFDHAVIQGRLKGGPGFAGDGVGDFIQPLAYGDFGGNPGNRIAGGLAGQGRAAADPGIDFNDIVGGVRLPVRGQRGRHLRMGVQGQLNVAAALNAQAANYLEAGSAEHLVLFIGQGLAGGYYDTVSGMGAHRVEVFHIADGNAVVSPVPDDFVFHFFPTHQGTLEQHLGDGAGGQAALHNFLEFRPGVGNAAAGAAQGIGRAYDQGQAHFPAVSPGRVHSGYGYIGRLRFADVVEKVAEILPILGLADGFQGGAEETDSIPFQDAGVGQGYGQVQPGLAAQGGQDTLRPFPLDNALDNLDRQWLDINPVGNIPVGHNGGRVGVDQDGGDPFLAQGFAGLGAGVVELGGLADDDGAGADYQDFVEGRLIAAQGLFFSSGHPVM